MEHRSRRTNSATPRRCSPPSRSLPASRRGGFGKLVSPAGRELPSRLPRKFARPNAPRYDAWLSIAPGRRASASCPPAPTRQHDPDPRNPQRLFFHPREHGLLWGARFDEPKPEQTASVYSLNLHGLIRPRHAQPRSACLASRSGRSRTSWPRRNSIRRVFGSTMEIVALNDELLARLIAPADAAGRCPPNPPMFKQAEKRHEEFKLKR